ncbi:MAG: peptidyl-prolyl cis-trans isomerase [Candidatus Glassbacteria bacterium]
MRTIFISCAAILVLMQSLIAGGNRDRFDELIAIARAEASLGLFSCAASHYEEAMLVPVKKENKIGAAYELASCYSDDLADTVMAIDTYLRIAEVFRGLDGVDVALYRIGRLLEETGQCHNAVSFYEKLIVDYPESGYLDYALEGSERCFHKNFPENVAVVHGQPVTVMELEDAIERLPAVYRARYSSQEGKREFLDKMIKDRIVEIYAREAGFTDDPMYLNRMHDAKMKILNEKFFLTEVREKVDVSEEEIIEYYESHKEEYVKPEEVKVRHILVETEKEAQEILKELGEGKSFEDLAQDFSIDMRTNDKGGDLGFISRGRTVKEIEEVAFSLGPGEISDVVKSRFGYHIVKVEARRPESIRSLDEMRELVISEVRRIKEEERSREVMSELKKKYNVRIFEDKIGGDITATGDSGER